MTDVIETCRACNHHATCKYAEEYLLFKNRISDILNKLDGEIIAEDVAQIEIKCKYFSKIPGVLTKSSSNLR